MTGSDVVELQEVIDDLQDAIQRGSGFGVCGELSLAASEAIGRGEACSVAASRALARSRAVGTSSTRSKIVAAEVRGPTAVTTVRDDSGGAAYEVRFVSEYGAWALPTVDLRAPSGLRGGPRVVTARRPR